MKSELGLKGNMLRVLIKKWWCDKSFRPSSFQVKRITKFDQMTSLAVLKRWIETRSSTRSRLRSETRSQR